MNVEFTIKAAQIAKARGDDAAGKGLIEIAAYYYAIAEQNYRELAEACPARRVEFMNFAAACCSGEANPERSKQERPKQPPQVETRESPVQAAQSSAKKITFADVAGLDEVKTQIKYKVIEPLADPETAKRYGIQPGAKILLYGPPGTGKSYIARAIAGEVDAEFFVVNCQDLISKYLGDSAQNLKAVFDKATQCERAIVFFDEFDSVASRRGESEGADGEITRFVGSFLTLVDGVKTRETNNKMLLLIAATNRPWALDPAMLRGGRFDTQIYVSVPDATAREFLIKKAMDGLPIDTDVSLAELVIRLDGYGGGDITSVCNNIKLKAYMRAVETGYVQNISRADCESVLAASRNPINRDDLKRLEQFKNGAV